ncbi:LacI family DNA-binding transcriptional regulator [Nakamurella panacisegetis]|uniref:LacI family DNA-binding transcriptional regulator n=1 Tax=Nakamurella panacisegetis TaxID=1090615 RepID=UPI00155F98EF|nr:LacI family DNA-binding transcriptional regulator [Nakamurella panacisegetis]
MTSTKHLTAATLADVARLAGISRATASRALGGYGSVSPSVRTRVADAAAQLGYRPNVVARNVRTGKTSTIGVVVADMSNPFFAQTTRGISDAARRQGYQVMVVNTDESLEAEELGLELLLNKRVDGVVVAAASRTDIQHLVEAQLEGFPLVLLDRRIDDLGCDQVTADNKLGARDAFATLIAAGHRRIAFISAADPDSLDQPDGLSTITSSGADRIETYLQAMQTLPGRAPAAEYLRLAGFVTGAAYRVTADLLALPERPTAIFASDSVIAIEVLWAIRDAGLVVPADISFAMGDDVPWALATNPAISAVAQPGYELGTRTIEMLLERIADPARPHQHLILPTEFHRRGSIGEPPPKR